MMEYSLFEIKAIKQDYKLNNLDYKILWNKYDAREKLGTYYMHQLAKDDDKINHLLPIVIRSDTALKNAAFDCKSVFESKRKTATREDIDAFTKELVGLNSWSESKEEIAG